MDILNRKNLLLLTLLITVATPYLRAQAEPKNSSPAHSPASSHDSSPNEEDSKDNEPDSSDSEQPDSESEPDSDDPGNDPELDLDSESDPALDSSSIPKFNE